MLTAAPVVVSPSSAEWRAQAAARIAGTERTAESAAARRKRERIEGFMGRKRIVSQAPGATSGCADELSPINE